MKEKIKNFMIGCGWAALILAAVMITFSCKSTPPAQQLQAAMDNLWSKSPEDNRKLHAIPVPITWKLGNLKGTTLAATTVRYDSIEIVFDWQEIQSKHEALEPIIAHEVAHAYDAFNKYGIDEFINIVNSEKSLAWSDRTVEKSAIEQENQTRRYLIQTYPKEFKNMLPYRRI